MRPSHVPVDARLRVAQFIRDDTYGQLRHAQNLLALNGIEHTFVAPPEAEPALTGARLLASNLPRRPSLATAREARRIAAELASHGIQAVHAHSVATLPAAFLVSKSLKVPLIHSPHALPVRGLSGSWPEVRVANSLVRLAGIAGSSFVSVSDGEHRLLARLAGRRPNYLVLNPVPDRYLQPIALRKEPALVVSLSRFWPQKAPELLLESFASFARLDPRARMLWAGDGPDMESCMREAARLGLVDRVEFLGKVADPLPLLQRASLFLTTSRFEAMPYSVLEAMATGTVVVATDIPAHREIDAGMDALRLCAPDPADLGRALAEQASDQASFAQRQRRARELVEQRHSLDVFAKEMERIYAEVLRVPLRLPSVPGQTEERAA